MAQLVVTLTLMMETQKLESTREVLMVVCHQKVTLVNDMLWESNGSEMCSPKTTPTTLPSPASKFLCSHKGSLGCCNGTPALGMHSVTAFYTWSTLLNICIHNNFLSAHRREKHSVSRLLSQFMSGSALHFVGKMEIFMYI